MWRIHEQCARVKRASCRMNRNFECRVCMNVSINQTIKFFYSPFFFTKDWTF